MHTSFGVESCEEVFEDIKNDHVVIKSYSKSNKMRLVLYRIKNHEVENES